MAERCGGYSAPWGGDTGGGGREGVSERGVNHNSCPVTCCCEAFDSTGESSSAHKWWGVGCGLSCVGGRAQEPALSGCRDVGKPGDHVGWRDARDQVPGSRGSRAGMPRSREAGGSGVGMPGDQVPGCRGITCRDVGRRAGRGGPGAGRMWGRPGRAGDTVTVSSHSVGGLYGAVRWSPSGVGEVGRPGLVEPRREARGQRLGGDPAAGGCQQRPKLVRGGGRHL